jgi:hypothetical protein
MAEIVSDQWQILSPYLDEALEKSEDDRRVEQGGTQRFSPLPNNWKALSGPIIPKPAVPTNFYSRKRKPKIPSPTNSPAGCRVFVSAFDIQNRDVSHVVT